MVTGAGMPDTAARLRDAAGPLSAEAVARMAERFSWFRDLPPDERTWIGLVAQSGVSTFLRWLSLPQGERADVPGLAGAVFGTAPPEMARAVTLQQTVDLVRVTVEVVEEHAPELAPPEGRAALREAVLVFSRDVAFATAEVYARAAEQRGAWDARLEALVVDHTLRADPADAVLSRAAALGWGAPAAVSVVVGAPPAGDAAQVLARVHHFAGRAELPALAGVQGDQLAVIVGLPDAAAAASAAAALAPAFGPGPVVYGAPVADLAAAGRCALAALAAARVAGSCPDLERPAPAAAVLPERALAGEPQARADLRDIHNSLAAAGGDLLATVACYVYAGGSIERTARELFVHPNTVRYRLRRATEVTGVAVRLPRGRFVLQSALVLGRIPERRGRPALLEELDKLEEPDNNAR